MSLLESADSERESVALPHSSVQVHVASLVLVLGRHIWVRETLSAQIEILAGLAFVPPAGDLFLTVVALHRSSVNTEEVFGGEQVVPSMLLSLVLTGGPTSTLR